MVQNGQDADSWTDMAISIVQNTNQTHEHYEGQSTVKRQSKFRQSGSASPGARATAGTESGDQAKSETCIMFWQSGAKNDVHCTEIFL